MLRRMNDAIRHRGPDSAGMWSDVSCGIFLGHRRLAILDLSAAGHQPMLSACGRYCMVYNGEIYNHLVIRKELEAIGGASSWRGHSDSETLLAAVSHWGFEDALTRFNGMFAIALWDRRERRLLLARDRMGEKPLYYGNAGGVFLFGSELKALRQHPAWRGEVDRRAVAQYLRFSSVPSPLSIFEGIHKLPPAHWISLESPDDTHAIARPYWDLAEIAARGAAGADENIPDRELIDTLEARLLEAVEMRTLSDVPLGAFLSGGIDSSLIVALMQARAREPVKTFTIGFDHAEYNEAHHAKAIAEHLGTQHTELYVDEDQALELIPRLPEMWDEPFADASQIPTSLVARMTRKAVTVSLSGDGGDELFYGYDRYESTKAIWQSLERYPALLRQPAGALANRFAEPLLVMHDCVTGERSPTLRKLLLRLNGTAALIGSPDFNELYRQMVSVNRKPPMRGALPALAELPAYAHPSLQQHEDLMMYADMRHYMPDTVLTKVDRATMAVGLESRAPLLDHTLVEHAWGLPLHAKLRDGEGKWALRQVLHRHVPRSLVERPKMGFGVPIDHWLRGRLENWADALLDRRRLDEQGLLDSKLVRRLFEQHARGRADNHYQLWGILMLQAWLASQEGS